MRMSKLFSQTLREAPADAEAMSHILLLRAGFIRQLGSGIFSYLPLAMRTLGKIEGIIREEMDAIGGQELSMPVVQPADIWKESGRWQELDEVLGRFKDRSDHDMVLAMTFEEAVADLVRREIKSYRQLPQLVYQIQTKWRDEVRSRAGLIRVREFTMKDSYSLDADGDGLERQYRNHYRAYHRLFSRCGLPTVSVEADVGLMGGQLSHEFMYLTADGEDMILHCPACGYSANQEVAIAAGEGAGGDPEGRPEGEPEQLQQEKIATPGAKTIGDLSRFLQVRENQTAKAVFLVGRFGESGDPQSDSDTERLILAVVRGDLAVNEAKLGRVTKALSLRPAQDDEIAASGAVAGYASPIGLRDVLVVVDESITTSPNLVAGANEEGYHLKNVNYPRDFEADLVGDIATVEAGDACSRCGQPLEITRGVEVGHIFQLGTRYSDSMGCTFLDAQGKARSVIMGSYGIGVGRLMACIAEQHRDEHGLMWPISVAPYQVHIVVLVKGEGPALEAAEKLYSDLSEAGIEVLYDDRRENPGVKFNDADLIGCPLRITVGERSLKKGEMELKLRGEGEASGVPVAEVVSQVGQRLAHLQAEIASAIVDVTDYKS